MKNAIMQFIECRLFWPMQITVVIIILLDLNLGEVVDTFCGILGIGLMLYVFGVIPNPFELIREKGGEV